MHATATEERSTEGRDQETVREVLEAVRSDGRTALSAPEAKRVCDAYGIAVPQEGLATSPDEAVAIAEQIGYPVVLKIVSPDILHKTEAKGVLVGVASATDVQAGYETIVDNAKAYDSDARITGVQIQQMLGSGQEVLIGAITDPTFGPVMTFGLGGVLVEVLRDVTFRLAPTSRDDALAMVGGIRASEVLDGVRGGPPCDRRALAEMIERVSRLVADFPQISEVDLNPVLATEAGATAVDARLVVSFDPADDRPPRYSQTEILDTMNHLMRPRAIAVIGASDQAGKIGNSVMRNLVDGGFAGEIYPVNPKATEILGKQVYADVDDLPDGVDVAVFCIPAKLVVPTIAKVGAKGIPAAILIPSGFAETGEVELQRELIETAREHGVRFVGPNIYGVYYTPGSMSAAFTTPYDVKGPVALASQSGGIGMAILGFSRSTNLGVSAIVGLGNKADIDEDDLLTFFEQDDATNCVALHMEDLKDGRAFVDVAQRVSKKKPIVVLKAGATPAGTKAAASHTAALAGDDKVYDDILRQAGVVRARGLNELLQFARCLPILPTPRGENVVIITGAGGSGVLLSDACYSNGLQLMQMPDDLNQAFMKFIPPFGAAGNPVDITGGEPPETYANTIKLGLEDERIHALVLGYWHTIVTPPMVFAEVVTEMVDELRGRGIEKPIVASLAGDVEVEQASAHLFAHGIPAFPYTTEVPVEVLAAKYRWARFAGAIDSGRAGS
ncbi:MAG TPA: acetate--CoA ligase family protein [Solirubrobacteraceae bacterium]|jgi:acetyl coenzyme A synthetase (ADP forming)-like protein|nr:acetate--CoA ligase family protein [Solirubrobacteraceae bacterium]